MKIEVQTGAGDWVRDVIIITFYGIFGGFFYSFSKSPERYDNCKAGQFVDWGVLTGIVCLSLVGLSVIKLVLRTCKVTEKVPSLWTGLESIGGLFIIICAIGLTVKDNDTCGDLHILAMVFYILVFVSLALAAIFLCGACLICGGVLASAVVTANAVNDHEAQPLNQQPPSNNNNPQGYSQLN